MTISTALDWNDWVDRWRYIRSTDAALTQTYKHGTTDADHHWDETMFRRWQGMLIDLLSLRDLLVSQGLAKHHVLDQPPWSGTAPKVVRYGFSVLTDTGDRRVVIDIDHPAGSDGVKIGHMAVEQWADLLQVDLGLVVLRT
ncbi:MAG: hypothetical protein ABIQ59_16520 [Nocardioidaceae bacterium]